MEKSESLEKSLRKFENLYGKKLQLGNGEFWSIPALPIGTKGKVMVAQLQSILDWEETNRGTKDPAKMGEFLDIASAFALSILRINYPKLTREQFDENDLIQTSHVRKLISIVQGQEEMNDLLAAMPASTSTNEEGEAKSRTANPSKK